MSDSVRRDTDIAGAGLADALFVEIRGSQDIRDRIPMALAEECDRLETCILGMTTHGKKAAASAIRVRALTALQTAVILRDENKGSDRPVQIIASILKNLKETMKELDVAPEMIETILQTLVVKAEGMEDLSVAPGGTPAQAP